MRKIVVLCMVVVGLASLPSLYGAEGKGGDPNAPARSSTSKPGDANARAPASAPTSASAPAGTGTVSGKVVDEAGKAVEGAEASVYVLDAARKTVALGKAKSGKDGAFKIMAIAPGANLRVWVSFQVPRGAMLMGEVRDRKVEPGKNTDVGTIRIAPARM